LLRFLKVSPWKEHRSGAGQRVTMKKKTKKAAGAADKVAFMTS
jgi:hypothetical protein